jgi:hypothetical protein
MDIEQRLDENLCSSKIIKLKCRNDAYAQNLYAALCNNRFFKENQEWTCSWRMSGGIVADIRNCGEDYLNWYCSGIDNIPNYKPEGCVSDEIRKDLLELGWTIEPYDCAADIL